jgi:hypothetical protein
MLAIVAGVWFVVIGIFAIVWALQARREISTTKGKFERLTGTAS